MKRLQCVHWYIHLRYINNQTNTHVHYGSLKSKNNVNKINYLPYLQRKNIGGEFKILGGAVALSTSKVIQNVWLPDDLKRNGFLFNSKTAKQSKVLGIGIGKGTNLSLTKSLTFL